MKIDPSISARIDARVRQAYEDIDNQHDYIAHQRSHRNHGTNNVSTRVWDGQMITRSYIKHTKGGTE